MIPFTAASLTKLEELLKGLGYRVRYEKGNFRTGACVLQTAKVIVVNKFSNLEVKIQSFIELLQGIEADTRALNEQQLAFYEEIKLKALTI